MVEAFGQKVALLEQQVPMHIEASISARMTELEHRLRGEFQEVHHRTVDAFADTIEQRVVGRIAALEASLIEQSHSIVSLREKSLKTDDNLQRLLGAVEKLCAKAEAQAQASRCKRGRLLPRCPRNCRATGSGSRTEHPIPEPEQSVLSEGAAVAALRGSGP